MNEYDQERAAPGHSVEFTGLVGAANLNGQHGTLIKFIKKEQRWSVRCEEGDRSVVNARPANLKLLNLSSDSHRVHGGEGYRGPTMGSVLGAGVGADSKEEYYLRTFMALALQAESEEKRSRKGNSGDPQELLAEAIGHLVDRGELDGNKGKRFVEHLHARTAQEMEKGNLHEADIMGFIDTVVLNKLVERLEIDKKGVKVLPKWLQGSLAGAMSFLKAEERGIRTADANKLSNTITNLVDNGECDILND